MGWALLGLLAAVEVALLVLRLRSGSQQLRLTALVRSGVLGLFGVTTVSGVTAWHPRYHLLGVWLAALALLAGWRLLRSRPDPEPQRRRLGIVLRTVGTLVVACVAVAPAVIFPPYDPIPPTGSHGVRSAVVDVEVDPGADVEDPLARRSRGDGRQVPVEIWYPDVTSGRYPLVVFSHGGLGTRSSNRSLYEDLASHGYIVAAIDHTGHALVSTDAEGRRTWIDTGYLRDLQSEDAKADPAGSLRSYREWMGIRVADIDAVVDHIIGSSKRAGAAAPYRLVDDTRVGVIGHSLGGAAALAVGRERADVRAVIALEAPFMADIDSVEDGEFVWNPAPYPTPVLNVYSDTSWDHLDDWPQYARNHELLTGPPPDVFNVHVSGVGHLGLTDLALASPLLTRLFDGRASTADPRAALEDLNDLCRRFFDSYLKDAGPFEPG